MTKPETTNLLKLISLSWNNFEADQGRVDAWFTLLEEYSSDEVKYALDQFIRSGAQAFPPNPSQLVYFIEQRRLPGLMRLSAKEAFTERLNHPIAAEAFRIWGGQDRYGMLPDASRTGKTQDRRTYDFAMRELEITYTELCERINATSHATPVARQLFELAERHGIDLWESSPELLEGNPKDAQ